MKTAKAKAKAKPVAKKKKSKKDFNRMSKKEKNEPPGCWTTFRKSELSQAACAGGVLLGGPRAPAISAASLCWWCRSAFCLPLFAPASPVHSAGAFLSCSDFKRCQMKAGCLPPANVNLFGDAAKVAEHLDLNNRELSTIKMSYELIDIDGSGEIDYDELLEFIESQRSPFSDAVIALVDEQGSGTLDFNSYFRIVCL